MPTKWIRVRDTRTDNILPNLVPVAWLDKFSYLKEVPSSRLKADRVRLEEPVQPADAVPVTEPKANSGRTTITEPAAPEKK